MKKLYLSRINLEAYMTNDEAEQTFAYVKSMPEDECYVQAIGSGKYYIGHNFPATVYFAGLIEYFKEYLNFGEWIEYHGITIL